MDNYIFPELMKEWLNRSFSLSSLGVGFPMPMAAWKSDCFFSALDIEFFLDSNRGLDGSGLEAATSPS